MIRSAINHLCMLALLLAITSLAHAQNIRVYGGNQVGIEDGSTNAMRIDETHFGAVNQASQKVHEFWIFNTDSSVPVQITEPVKVIGPNPGDFQILQPYTTIEEGSYVPLTVTFDPQALGSRTAVIVIPNNTPGSKEEYSFTIKGESISGFPVSTPDIDLNAYGSDVKIKVNKKTGDVSAQWKIGVGNVSNLPIEGGFVTFYHSSSEVLSFSDSVILAQVPLKPLKAAKTGKPTKYKSVKMKAFIPDDNYAYLFAVVTMLPVAPEEFEQANNVAFTSFTINPVPF